MPDKANRAGLRSGRMDEGSLLMLGVLLRRRGWPVTYLGQEVPFADLAAFFEGIKPEALVLVGMREDTAHRLAGMDRANGRQPLVTFAGRACVLQPELQSQVQGLYLGDTIQAGVARLEERL